MKNRIDKTVHKYRLISNGDTVLIAFSGGADSVMLCEYLLSVREKYSLTLKAAHIEHGLRGEESLKDFRFAEDYCRNNDIEFFALHINAAEEAEAAGLGVEEYSRNRRYEFFETIPCDKIATAHNLSDNAETLLFRLARGTSLKGVCSIPVRRDKIVRPLIEISGADIRRFLDSAGIPYCIDSTNSCNDYTRNYIRNVIIPEFRKINPDFENCVSRFISNVCENEAFLESHINEIYKAACSDNRLSCAYLAALSDCEQNRIIAEWLNNNNLPFDSKKIGEIASLISKSSKVQIKNNTYAVSSGGSVRIAELDLTDETIAFSVTKKIVSVKDFLNKCEFKNKKFDFYCDCDKIIGNVAVRSRAEGDFISPAGRGCTKSLKKLYNELKIPAEIRKRIPVICDDEGVIGIYGFCTDRRVAVNSETEAVLILNVSTEDNINE